jgi:hypothetical protein
MREWYTEEEMDALDYDRDKLREYFTTCAIKMFTQANRMPESNRRLIQLRTAMNIFKYMEQFIESCYKGPK